jgi:hypothetical protein
MKLSAPTQPIFLIAVILMALGVVGYFLSVPVLTPHSFFFMLVGSVILIVGNLVKGI